VNSAFALMLPGDMLHETNAEAVALPPLFAITECSGSVSAPDPETGMVVGGSLKLSDVPPGGSFWAA
jgi:hypothetical protein